MTDITRKANEKGVTVHTHVMGNKGVNRIVSAYVNGGKDEMRNTLVHVHSVYPEDYKRMADHNIYVTEGMLWHHFSNDKQELLKAGYVPMGMETKSYPMKSFFDNGIVMSSHSDFPALSGSPDDPFGIMEVAVTGVYYPEQAKPIENERGSISTGKYADFLLLTKDVLECPVTEIHEAKPAATYFEGKKVFENKK